MDRDERRKMHREAVADAAYDAWRAGKNYDAAWDRAEDAVYDAYPYDRYEAEDVAHRAAFRKPRP